MGGSSSSEKVHSTTSLKQRVVFPDDFEVQVPAGHEWVSAFDINLRLRDSAFELAHFWHEQGTKQGSFLRAINSVGMQEMADRYRIGDPDEHQLELHHIRAPVVLWLSRSCPFYSEEGISLDDSPFDEHQPGDPGEQPICSPLEARTLNLFGCEANTSLESSKDVGETHLPRARKRHGKVCCESARLVLCGVNEESDAAGLSVFREALRRMRVGQTHIACINHPVRSWSNGSSYQGQWSDGFTSGDFYDGKRENEERKGDMHRENCNDGQVREGQRSIGFPRWAYGCPQGVGRVMYGNGDVYEGQWNAGKANGEGACSYNNGSFYRGQWENNKQSGMGEEHCNNGEVYHGEFSNGLKEGCGMQITHGGVYKGQFSKNHYHGAGSLWTGREGQREGYFVNGEFVGEKFEFEARVKEAKDKHKNIAQNKSGAGGGCDKGMDDDGDD